MENYKVILNEDAGRFELWVDGKIVTSVWEWLVVDEDEAEDLFIMGGYI